MGMFELYMFHGSFSSGLNLVHDMAEDSIVVKGEAGLVVDPKKGLFGEEPAG